MGSKIANIKNGVYNLGKDEIAIIRNGKLRIYRTSQALISQKMEIFKDMEEVCNWLKEEQVGQTICLINDGIYYSDYLTIEVTNKTATLYITESINKNTEGILLLDVSFFIKNV